MNLRNFAIGCAAIVLLACVWAALMSCLHAPTWAGVLGGLVVGAGAGEALKAFLPLRRA